MLLSLFVNMGIELRGGDVGVTKHRLDDPQLGAIGQEVRREGMPECVWCDFLAQVQFSHIPTDHFP